MRYGDFCKRVGESLTAQQYMMVEEVYLMHPDISADDDGESMAAWYLAHGGMLGVAAAYPVCKMLDEIDKDGQRKDRALKELMDKRAAWMFCRKCGAKLQGRIMDDGHIRFSCPNCNKDGGRIE